MCYNAEVKTEEKEMEKTLCGLPLFYEEETDSTNERAKCAAEGGEVRDAVFLADRQTAGRGRRGRSFYSPHDGIYISYLLHPATCDLTAITVFAAVALCRAIERVSPARPQIKWVNDLYLCGKKIAGILAEGKIGADGTPDYVILGIGVNVNRTAFPDGLSVAGDIESATGTPLDKEALIAALTEEILHGADGMTMEEYRRRSFLIGKNVTVHKVFASYPAHVDGIADNGNLLLTLADGEKEALCTGEVSVYEETSSAQG